jgi:hypothetical protein
MKGARIRRQAPQNKGQHTLSDKLVIPADAF